MDIKEILLDALLDTLKLLPWLIVIYIVIELIEHKTRLTGPNNRLNGRLGPLIGAATGLIPQCGFSVMAAKLFEQKYITVGTLLAIFLATSDEAFIILLSSGQGAVWLLPLIVLKIFVGVAAGYAADGLLNAFKKSYVGSLRSLPTGKDIPMYATTEIMTAIAAGRKARTIRTRRGRFFCARRRSRSSNALPADGCTTKRGR